MEREMMNLPLQGRDATIVVAAPVAGATEQERTIDVVWTTGARVLRARWEGWDDYVEYEEELEVSPKAVRLERLNTVGTFLDSHMSWGLDSVIGSVVPGSVRLEGGKGYAKVRLTGAADAQPAVQRILDGTVRSVSVGYRVNEYRIEKRDGQREIWRAVDWEPYEISAVAIPADAGAQVRSAEHGNEKPRPDLVAPCAIQRASTTAAPAAITKGKTMPKGNEATAADETRAADTTAEQPAASAPATQPVNAAEIRAAEQRRASEILGLCQRHGQAGLAADMIARGITLDAARAEILDKLADAHEAGATGEPAPAQARNSAADQAFSRGVEEALMHRHDPSKNQLTPAGREFRGFSLLELGRLALERRGVNTRGMSKAELAREALMGRAAVGYHSTSDFPYILANIATKTLRQGYDSTPRSFTVWARSATLPDFKTVQRTQLGGAPDLIKVPEGGEFSYGTIGEGAEQYALSTYGRIIAITRQTLINDDLSAFTRVPTAFGAAASDLESDIVYAILSANANMFDGNPLFDGTNHGNVGTAAVIGETSITEAYEMMAKQKGLEGRLISILPRYLITSPGTRMVEAKKLITATTPAQTSQVNPYAGSLELVQEPRLLPASGAKPWYLAADPSRIDTIEYGFLEGNEGVYSETRVGFEVDGVEIKARHDFGAKSIDWRGLFKNAGL